MKERKVVRLPIPVMHIYLIFADGTAPLPAHNNSTFFDNGVQGEFYELFIKSLL